MQIVEIVINHYGNRDTIRVLKVVTNTVIRI
ncbi:MAG: hypothetical protein FJX70_02070 [Alphaproteobacteria bacterium]|nr:hypothetical protein [Alphaproteobacteria bacterium]